ncbi:MAG TPA: efflux RND transporter periplasmic adaptor subunit [Alphaproteobacteria bacterium]|nr:efflux RND transporter periplasmic adaptor subunit [Alphaproteobacteria bacterium]
MKARKFIVFGMMAAALAAGGYYYYFVYAPAKLAAHSAQSATRTAPPAPVMVAQVSQEAVPVQLGTVGSVQQYTTVSVKSLVDGQIFKAGFVEGQYVHKGDLLFQIDPRPFEAALQKAQATLESDKAQALRADLDLKRFAELAQKDFAPQQQYEQARATADVAHASVLADEAAIDQAKLSLEYCQIRSPIDGRTGNILVNVGNLVKANDTVALVMINQTRPIYVSFTIPEQSIADVRGRMASGKLYVDVTIPGDPGPPARGEITFINNQVDVTTGTIQLKATFPNLDDRLVPGQFVQVKMTLATLSAALVVPSQAVQTGQKGTYVYVVKADKTVEQRPVEVGPTVDAKSVIQKGLEAGEQVVTDGQLRLFPGAAVEIRNAA